MGLLGTAVFQVVIVIISGSIALLDGHHITEEVRHALFHEFPALVEVVVHADPCECDSSIEYHPTAHHRYLAAAD